VLDPHGERSAPPGCTGRGPTTSRGGGSGSADQTRQTWAPPGRTSSPGSGGAQLSRSSRYIGVPSSSLPAST
jgi:hypothetical protein